MRVAAPGVDSEEDEAVFGDGRHFGYDGRVRPIEPAPPPPAREGTWACR